MKELSKAKEISQLKNKPITKRENMLEFAENVNVLALDLPLIWRSLAIKDSTRNRYSIIDGKDVVGITYPIYRDRIKKEIIPAFFVESLNGTGDKIPYYTVSECIVIFKEMRKEMLEELKGNF